MPRVRVPASSANLGPGFDCLGLALDLHNVVELEERPAGLEVVIRGEGAQALSAGPDNLVVVAAERLFAAVGRRPPGLAVRLENAVPLSRGLGSSAAAIVGGLVAANALVGSPLDRDALFRLATEMEGHPDNVAPALFGGLTVAVSGEGFGPGAPVCIRFDPPPGLELAVVIPDRPMSTAEARRVLPDAVARRDAVFNIQRACLLVAALREGRLDLLTVALDDRVHQPYRAALLPGLEEALRAARRSGLLGACLSGSGSTVLVFLAPDSPEEERVAALEAVVSPFRLRGIGCAVKRVRPAAAGAEVLEPPREGVVQ